MARAAGIRLDDVVATAADIADRSGIDAATPSAVARALGVRTPSLYHHVAGTAGLRRALAFTAAAELTVRFESAAGDETGPDTLRAIAIAYHRFAVEHPGLHAALLPAPLPGEDDELAAALAEPVRIAARAMGSTGALDARSIHLVRAFRAMVFGFAFLETQHGFGIPVDIEESFDVAIDLVIDGITGS